MDYKHKDRLELADLIEEQVRQGYGVSVTADSTADKIETEFYYFSFENLPEVTSNGTHYETEQVMVGKDSDPDVLEEKARGFLAIAAKRRADITKENAEYGPIRKTFIGRIYPNKMITDSSYRELPEQEQRAIDLMVQMEIKYNNLRAEFDRANRIK